MAPPSHVSLNTKTVIHCTVLHTHGCGDWKHHVQRLLKYPCSLIYCPAIPTNPTQPVVDKNVQRVQNTLASMLDRLEVEIETVEKRIGDKMHVLDRDKDGMCSAEEIAYVVQHVLTSSSTAEEAKAIAGSMDTDSDGQISVAELIAWVKKHSEQVLNIVGNAVVPRLVVIVIVIVLIALRGSSIHTVSGLKFVTCAD